MSILLEWKPFLTRQDNYTPHWNMLGRFKKNTAQVQPTLHSANFWEKKENILLKQK